MTPSLPHTSSRKPDYAFTAFCWLIALAKLALVARSEILSDADDSVVYGNQSLTAWTLGFPPGYPLWLQVCQFFGVPQRLAVEFLYLAAAAVLCAALKRYFGRIPAYLCVTVLMLSPSTYYLFNIGFTDGFATALCLFGVASTLHLFSGTVRLVPHALILGSALGYLAITRNEDPLLAFWLLLLLLGCAVAFRSPLQSFGDWRLWRRPLGIAALAGLTACLIVGSLCLSYYRADGVFTRGIVLLPGHSRLLNNLARIQTGEPQRKHVPISLRSRELAYWVSPVFAKYRAKIEDPADGWQVVSRNAGIPAGEIGGGWIWHAINMQVMNAAGGKPAVAQREYDRINAQIEAAFRDGRLHRRFILHPLLGGDIPGLLAAFPSSFVAVLSAAFTPEPDKPGMPYFAPEIFNEAYLRRAAFVAAPADFTVQGWAFPRTPGRHVLKVEIASDIVAHANVLIGPRTDVADFYAKIEGHSSNVVGFLATLKSSSADAIRITYTLDNGAQIQSDRLHAFHVTTLPGKTAPGEQVEQSIDALRNMSKPALDVRRTLQARIVRSLEKKHWHIPGSLLVIAVLLLSLYRWLMRRDTRYRLTGLFLSFLALSWLARVVLYTLVEARAWPGAQTRYLALANTLGLVMFWVAVSALPLLFVKTSKPQPS